MFLAKKIANKIEQPTTKFIYYLIFTVFCSSNFVFSQQISIDNSIPLQDLIENNLIEDCSEISNITSSINGSIDGLISYGTFQRGNSNFPLSNGIVIATGDVSSGGNTTNNTPLSEGTGAWGTDPDIETYLGVGNTSNATSIEFDFIAITDIMQFNYLLASEEYFANYPCNSSDGFVFLIRESSSVGPYQNIAVVPVSGDPVTVKNIHVEIPNPTGGIECTAINDQYFDGYSFNNTNYNGRTSFLSATTSLTPNTQYHIKLIVADQNVTNLDPSYDSAVFIEANSLYELELGDNISSCVGNVLLNAEIPNPIATYTWHRDNVIIPGETNATITATSTGLYRVDVNISGISCTIQDYVNVTIESELYTDSIPPYIACDANGDGQEFFDLTTKDLDVENAIQNFSPNNTIRYYATDNDARNNPNNNITAPISTEPTTIYVRVEDTVLGCLIYGTIDLEINPTPTIIQPSDINECDNDNTPNSSTEVDLTQRDDEITGGNTDLTVTYHFTQSGAQNNTDIVPTPYITNTDPNNSFETLYVRVTNTSTGCASANGETLTVNITNGNTGLLRDLQYIDACDADYDGSATFNLTQVLNDILNGETGFSPPTYHISQVDAETGTNPITDPQNYVNEVPEEQIIYLRLEDSSTGCYSVIPFEIHTNLLLTGTNIPIAPSGFSFCDQGDDGSEVIDLTDDVAGPIISGLVDIVTSITFYNTLSDRDTNTNPITNNLYTINNSPQTIYFRIQSDDCIEYSEVDLLLEPIINFAPGNPVPFCDGDNDGFTTIDLSSLNAEITGGNPNFAVSYFTNQNDADTNTNPLPQYYDTSSGTLHARIENVFSGCYSVNDFEIIVNPAPTTTHPNDIVVCNTTSTTTDIRLHDLIDNNEIVANSNNYIIDFFTDFDQADNFDSDNPINNLDKQNFTTSTQTIYIRVESIDTGCHSFETLNVIVNTIPIITTVSPYQVCVYIGSPEGDFYLEYKDAEILNGQIGMQVRYFRDSLFTDEINKTVVYNSSGAETIYYKIENITDETCYNDGSFLLEIASNPNYNTNFIKFYPSDCLNDFGTRVFDLEAKRQEIAQGSTDSLTINFYLSLNDAQSNASNFLPDLYSTSNVGGQFYVRIENNANGCAVAREEDEITFSTYPTPIINSATIIPVCDTDTDGIATINLNNGSYSIENVRSGDVTFTFYEDAALTIPIPSNQISAYPVNNSATIYVEVKNNYCTDSAPLNLQVNVPPTLFNAPLIPACETPDNIYDLSNIDSYLLPSNSNFVISYHDTQTNAENNTGIYINNEYNYPNPGNYIVFSRVENQLNDCPSFQEIELQINPNPIANTPPILTTCDNDFDNTNTTTFDLSQQDIFILGTQNASNFSIYYYNNQQDAEIDLNRINYMFDSYNDETIFARIENNNTRCYDITQFQTIINPLPIIPIDDIQSLCPDEEYPKRLSAGNAGETYLWSTGETSDYILVGYNDLGDYSVTVTTPLGCSYTKDFTLIESESANIDVAITVDFADPNSIIVYASGIGNYQYILDDGEPQSSNVFNNVTLGSHEITIIDLNGCEPIYKTVYVSDIPKFVTPNNDGYFDTWHIMDASKLPGTFVYIYNRYGKLLKTLSHNSSGWDGTYNGENMPTDDYWFIAQIIQNGEKFEIKGHFALKR